MAENPKKDSEQSKSTETEKDSGVSLDFDKELRLRSLKDRQNEERQRKLEEIKAQALAAQVFKEQKEQERRKRLDELRIRDDERRHQVEERKRQIQDAERDRLEFILRRNQERDQRIESKRRNERSNAVFAFGSSTPRMLDPNDVTASYWNTRRATSIQNIVAANPSVLTRRQSERELDAATKKRAISATGLERTGESSAPVVPAGCVSGYTGRRRTDLVPTIPAKDSISSSRKSLNQSPGRAYSMTRLDQLAKPRRRHDHKSLIDSNSLRPLSSSYHSSVTRSMSHLAVSKSGPSPTRRELNKADSRSMQQLTEKSLGMPRTTRTSQLREQKLLTSSNCSEASSRPSSSLSQQSTISLASSASVRHRLTTAPRKPRPISIAVTGISSESKTDNKPPLPKAKKPIAKPTTNDKVAQKSKTKTRVVDSTSTTTSKISKEKSEKSQVTVIKQKSEEIRVPPSEPKLVTAETESYVHEPQIQNVDAENQESKESISDKDITEVILVDIEDKKEPTDIVKVADEPETNDKETEMQKSEQVQLSTVELDTSPEVQKPKETVEEKVEEQPKQVLQETQIEQEKNKLNTTKSQPIAERQTIVDVQANETIENEMTASMTKVRINTEEEAKAALAERRRLIREEAERQAELERLRIEAEAKAELERQQKEEEQIRELIELQRQTEQERLEEAIREAQKREEEERLRKEEEQRLKLLKEEAEKKAKEEAEKQKAELQERLKNEEKEREARRKRVEAIMLRTRGKNANPQSVDENKSEEMKNEVEGKVNGTKIEEQENGTTKLSKDVVNNVIPSELVKNANTVTIESMDSNDSINSNNTWRDNQQYGNFVCNNNS